MVPGTPLNLFPLNSKCRRLDGKRKTPADYLSIDNPPLPFPEIPCSWHHINSSYLFQYRFKDKHKGFGSASELSSWPTYSIEHTGGNYRKEGGARSPTLLPFSLSYPTLKPIDQIPP